MEPIHYYEATLADVPQLVAIRIATLIEITGPPPPEAIGSLEPVLAHAFRRLFHQGTYIHWLATVGGVVAGSGGLSIREHPGSFKNPSGKVGYLMSMYTLPAYRGRGICSTLVQRLLQAGKAKGIDYYELHATPAGEPVYQAQGFKLHPEPTYRLYLPGDTA